ncbi:hypothetical protein [Nodularia sp. UHCC 0506]|uniref:hypothetical protein n=1 Tax=Nodularia sp. UHCC 0506 TaxID=3110243 RepID=UPI002B202840|nr:hypothetical protein [Nodularia sp. UHCC 0506]MEA5516989.1 hypothetical protein [Nodularia sp. UHCC 0506]
MSIALLEDTRNVRSPNLVGYVKFYINPYIQLFSVKSNALWLIIIVGYGNKGDRLRHSVSRSHTY